MGAKIMIKSNKSAYGILTDRASGNPYSALERHRPLTKPEFAVFDAIREAVPIVGAAIDKIIRLVGRFEVECESLAAQKELKEFLKTVPTEMCGRGINSFVTAYLDSLLMYGTAVGEIVCTAEGNIAGLFNAPLGGLELIKESDPFSFTVAVRREGGRLTPIKYPERILVTTANPTADRPEGRSVLDGLPFVTGVLLKIFDSIGSNFERVGNLRYAVTYRPSNESDAAFGADRAAEIASEWSAAMSDKETVKDFVAVGDVDIKVIGADSQMLDCEVPVRQMLEQIVAKLGIPPFMLGLSWSSTERMSAQQADTLTSELEYYRELLNGVIERICRAWLKSRGYYCKLNIVWNDITLQDEVDEARARLLRAQAAQLEAKEDISE